MKVALDLDDFSVLNNSIHLLRQIKEHYVDFKVSLFTIPLHAEYEMSQQRVFREKALSEIKKNLDWMEIIPHGLTHIPREFEHCDRHTMQMTLRAIDEQFNKDGLPYVKGFKAPYWLWNEDVVRVLDENGWWGAIDRNQPDMLKTKKTYTYTHSIDEPFWKDGIDVMKLHGHMNPPSTNDLEGNIVNILKLPADVEWVFASELVK